MVLESLAEWNPWWRERQVEEDLTGKEREALAELIKTTEFREMKVLIGVRRSGKSTLFYQMIDSLLKAGVAPQKILLINFEDDVLARKTLKEIFDTYQSNISPDVKPYLFLDEVHRCKEWSLFLRKLYDLRKVKQVFITDSSSKFIKPEYAGTITGRNITISVLPLSFKEYLDWREVPTETLAREEINRIKKELQEYLRWGGYPEVFFKSPPAKKRLLTEYFSDIIHKDIIERYNAKYVKVKFLADFLAANPAGPFSPRKFSRSYGLSLESINTYLQYFEEVFLFFFVPRFSYSIRSQQLSPKKVYVCDPGFFNAVGFRFAEDIGRVYENVVFIEMKRKNKEVYYWKGKYECDFLVKEGLEVRDAIQVCYSLKEENLERERRGLMEAMEEFDLPRGLIITGDYEGEEEFMGRRIAFIPLWKWLLETEDPD
jgi:predicted AAA+ superfamily ATPase